MNVDLDTLKSSISIGDILRSEGVDVPNRDKYRVPCVLHNGTDPNMAIDEDSGLYYCFVCGAGGSVIDLYAGLNNLSVKESIDELAKDKNLEFNPLKVGVRSLYNKLEKAKEMSRPEIEVPALTGLEEGYRGLSRQAVQHFGLARCDEGVFIPHYDLTGKVCSYSIRRSDEDKPKYKNNKGYEKNIPFGLYKNKKDILEKGFVIICEGQFDLIALWDEGYRNCIALCGSSFLESQAHLLLALTDNMVLILDGDEAGIAGMAKIIKQWKNTFNITPAFLEPGMDPCDWAKSRRLNV